MRFLIHNTPILIKKIIKEPPFLRLCISVLSFTFLLFSLPSTAQHHLAVEVSGNGGAGWWMHNYGSTHPDTLNNRGWGRSRFRPAVGIQTNVLYQKNKWRAGIGIGYHWMFDAHLNGNNHRYNFYERIRIAPDDKTHFWNYSLIGEYNLFNNHRWELFTLHGEIGAFGSNTVHPDAERFGRRLWMVFGVKNALHLKYFDITIMGRYRNASIVPNDDLYYNEIHNIVLIGGELGLRVWLF